MPRKSKASDSWWPIWLRWRFLRFPVLLVVVIGVMLAGYLYRIDQTITATFEGRRWSIPAQVYAAPLEIYPGAGVTKLTVQRELERLGYQRNPKLSTPGTFNTAPSTLTAHLRDFHFMDGYRGTRKITIEFTDRSVTSIKELSGDSIGVLRLEPVLIGSFFANHGEDRIILPPEQIPTLLRDGLKSIEDRNFDNHVGFDLRGILRALWVNLRAGRTEQGGSTLTQQLVKSYFLDNRRTLGRKLREVAMAVILEARFTKDDLLDAYINEIYLAQDGIRAIHGFGLGSQYYFNKPLQELAVDEIALLLTVIRGPSFYNPYRNPERARERRNRILNQLNADNLIDEQTRREAISTELRLAGRTKRRGAYYPAFMDLVRDQLYQSYPKDELASVGLKVFTTLSPSLQDQLQQAANDSVSKLRSGAEQRRDLQVSGIVSQAQTGEVLAVLGGTGDGRGGYNRALKTNRPVGSLLKPFVYLSALERDDFHLATQIIDAPIRLDLPNGDVWEPHNFDDQYRGSVPLVRALADSLNLATVQLSLQLGIDTIAQRIAQLLPDNPPKPYPALVLGAMDMNVITAAELYGTLASGGFHTKPKTVIAVLDENGNPLTRYPIATDQVIQPEAVSQIDQALTLVMDRGTGRGSRHSGSGVRGKTGTSNDFRDSWFAGYDANYLAVLWVGNDDNSPMGLTGSSGALKVWDQFMLQNPVQGLPGYALPNYVAQTVEYDTGFLAQHSCADVVTLLIPQNTQLPVKPECQRRPGFGSRLRRWLGGPKKDLKEISNPPRGNP